MDGRHWLWLGARLVAAVVLVGWALSYLGTGREEKELQKTLEAMKQVHSFRVVTTADPVSTQHSDFLWEVDCSRGMFHSQWHLVQTATDPPKEMTQEHMFVAGEEFERQRDGSWARARSAAGATPKAYCRNLAQGADSNLLPNVATMIKRGILQKGDRRTVNGVQCREWKITLKGGMSLEHDTLCVGADDHLPYEFNVDWENAHSVFSAYNSDIQFDAPDVAPPRPARP